MLSTVSTWALAHSHPEDKALHARSVEATHRTGSERQDHPLRRSDSPPRVLLRDSPPPEITGPIWEKALKNANEKTLNYAIKRTARPRVPRMCPH